MAEIYECDDCGALVDEDEVVCPFCGAEFDDFDDFDDPFGDLPAATRSRDDFRREIAADLDRPCPCCGKRYGDIDTGLTYGEVYQMMWRTSEDPSTWRYKGRSGVLGFWHELKQRLWEDHLERCYTMEDEDE